MERAKWIESTLQRALQPQHLVVEDESALHAGHAGAASGGGHFRALIVSDAFRGLDRIARQRAVYAALGDAMRTTIHALALRTLTPDEWAAQEADSR
ncbi:MAG: BolA family transcriptional regulator [Deltaproteobacteria bacterium]|nr:BolA family transcriptional regulator [Deltaproteobacteria bacterium]